MCSTLLPTALVAALAVPSLPAFAQRTTTLPTVTDLDGLDVIGRAQTLYKSEDAAVATRTDTPLALVPQSVQVLPRELIDDQAVRQINDLYRSISGIGFFSYAGVTLRGFRQENVLYDGLRGDPYAGFSVPQLFDIERVEVLKGPVGALYGGGEPGGVINYVTRKPGHQAARRVELQVGAASGQSVLRCSLLRSDWPCARRRPHRYRIGAYADGEDGFRWNTDSQSQIGDASVAVVWMASINSPHSVWSAAKAWKWTCWPT